MPTVLEIPYTPQQGPQLAFHRCGAKEVLLGGAAGGGKTFALCGDAVSFCLGTKGGRVLMMRRTYSQVWDTIVSPILMPWLVGIADYNGEFHAFTFRHNGATLRLGTCESDHDIHKYDGPPWHRIYFDELTQFNEYPYEHAATKLLRLDRPGILPQIKSGTNPWDIGLQWVKRRFRIGIEEPYRLWADEHGNTRCFIPAKVWDNKALLENQPDYPNQLRAITDPAKRRAYLEGDWGVQVGQFFDEWDPVRHVVDDFEIPGHWRKWRCLDYGLSAPFSALWLAKDIERELYYFYREAPYEPILSDKEQANVIKELSVGERYVASFAPPDMWTKRGDDQATSPADIYEREGVILSKANNHRLHGAAAWRRALAPSKTGTPTLRVMRSCRNLIRTIPVLQRSKHHPEDVETEGEDHLYDAGRYGLVMAMGDQDDLPIAPKTMIYTQVKRKSFSWENWRGA